MVCDCCKAKWDIIKDGIGTEKCPICKSVYSEKPELQIFESFVELSVMLYNRFGNSVFEDKRRVENYFNDYFPLERKNWETLTHYLSNIADNHYSSNDDEISNVYINLYNKAIQTDNSTRFSWLFSQTELKREYLDSLLALMQESALSDTEKIMTARYAIENKHAQFAVDILDDIQNNGNDEAKLLLAELYGTGKGVDLDYFKSANLLLSIENKDNSIINFRLGYAFHTGRGVDIDLDLAKKYYRIAVSQGNSNAAFCLYRILIDDNTKSAMEYLKKAVEAEDDVAEYEYAIRFLYGDCIEENIDNAVYYLEKSAEHGNRDAIKKLIYLYKTGTKVKQDLEKVRNLEERMA